MSIVHGDVLGMPYVGIACVMTDCVSKLPWKSPTSLLPYDRPFGLSYPIYMQVPIYCDDLVTARYLDVPGSGYGQPQQQLHQGQHQQPDDGGYDQQQRQQIMPAATANGRPLPPSGAPPPPPPPPPWYNMLQSLMEGGGHPVSSAPWGVEERVAGGGAGQKVAVQEAAKKMPPKAAESRIKAAVLRDRLRGRGRHREDAAIEVLHRPR